MLKFTSINNEMTPNDATCALKYCDQVDKKLNYSMRVLMEFMNI